jgi:glycosyltransferase involved in cell wall biosynthesis
MMNAANKGEPSRKGLREALLAWRKFVNAVPDALLYLHTDAHGRCGIPLTNLVAQLGLGNHVQFVDDYHYVTGQVTSADLNLAYNAADVLLNPSMGEGFGIPILEAQAAGTPVIVTDWTAMPEICFAGWRVGGTPFMTYQNAMQMLPSVDEIVGALHAAHTHRSSEVLRHQARTGALAYAIDRVYRECWQPLLGSIAADLTVNTAI